jgi:phage shock protein PspC (stress-responsive transcriptional regulator)
MRQLKNNYLRMKKTITVNLNNTVFNIDDDAFDLLQTYLFEIEGFLISRENKQDLLLKIESRIANFFSSKLNNNKQLIDLQVVHELIELMGKPSLFVDATIDSLGTMPYSSQNLVKRFYRDPENGWFGGVAAGMAIYFSWDVTLIRIAMFVLLILGMGSIVPVYLVLWFVVPAAVTPIQKMEMQGDDFSFDFFKQELIRMKAHWASNKFKQSTSEMSDRLLIVLHLIFKALFWFVGIISGLLIVLLLASIFTLLGIAIFHPATLAEYAPGIFLSQNTLGLLPNLLTIIISLILVVGCPIFMLLFLTIRSISGRYKYSHIASWSVFFVWIASLFLLYTIGFSGVFSNKHHLVPFKVHWNNSHTILVDDVRNTEQFNAIEVYGNIELVLMNAPVQNLLVSSQPDYLSHITTKVEDGILHIYTDELSFSRDVKIIVSSNNIKSILAKGACSVKTISQYKAPMFSLQLIGASQGNMNMKVDGLLDVIVKGASQVFFKGSSQTLKFKAVGASKIDAFDLEAQFVNVAAVGVSRVKVFAVKSLNADAVGASEVECKGSPEMREIHTQIGSTVVIN